MQYYNVHSHVFTMNNAPKRFLHLYLPDFLASAVDKITNTKAGAKAIEKLLSTLGGNGGKRYASFLAIGKSNDQLEVFKKLKAQYDDNNMRFIGLSMNMEYCGAGASVSGYEGQLEEILNIKRQFPENLDIFLGIDPRWKPDGKTLKETVEKYFNTDLKINDSKSVKPFCGIKIYPSMGFYAFDARLMETFEWAAEHGVPVLSHCSYLGGVYNNDTDYVKNHLNQPDPYTGQPYRSQYIEEKSFKHWIFGTKTSNNNLNTCSYFMEPVSFISLMNHFQGKPKPLKICLAHFGGGNQIKDPTNSKIPYGNGQKNWFLQLQEMLGKYESLYTDISYALHDDSLFRTFFEELNQPQYGKRIMFGTDYFLTEREQAENETYSKFKKEAMDTPLSNFQNISAWDQSARNNIADFLKSDYHD